MTCLCFTEKHDHALLISQWRQENYRYTVLMLAACYSAVKRNLSDFLRNNRRISKQKAHYTGRHRKLKCTCCSSSISYSLRAALPWDSTTVDEVGNVGNIGLPASPFEGRRPHTLDRLLEHLFVLDAWPLSLVQSEIKVKEMLLA